MKTSSETLILQLAKEEKTSRLGASQGHTTLACAHSFPARSSSSGISLDYAIAALRLFHNSMARAILKRTKVLFMDEVRAHP